MNKAECNSFSEMWRRLLQTETCPGIQTDVTGFLCGTKTGNDNIGCCGSCTSKNTHRLAKILGGVFGSLAVLVIVFGLCWRWDMKRNRSF